jgi:hypothetical protein
MTAGSTVRRRRVNRPRTTRSRTRTTTSSGSLDMLARLGFTARGITYILIGLLALALGLGKAAPEADRTGALQAIAAQPYGRLILWSLAIGLAAMALWRFAQSYYGVRARSAHRGGAEAMAFARGVLYTVFFAGTLSFVLHNRLPQSTDQQSRDFASQAMQRTGGRILVLVVGAVITLAGLYLIKTGLTKSFMKDLRMTGARRRTRETVERLGVAGNVARGLVFGAVGVFMLDAAASFNVSKAKGVDSTLRSFAHTPLGPWLLIAVAIGLALFGVYSLLESRWHRGV